ncbi:laccase-2-like [Tribolium madens]|uniref:laccase-2-like n=1 Tax=Tribolium madens TaxID=41895 RepID=UPI001CF74011|nr:laccase-2-like [Tribolium madens]XP_044271355.1 laccase-2-like [Tribolium madens]
MSCCQQSNYKMSKTQNVMLRVTIVMGMMVAVVAVLYLTPLPEGTFLSCDRPCHDLDWPMICRIKIQIENRRSCKDCSFNDTSSEVITVNGQSPGPAIQICQNDILVVDVVNKMPGHSVTVHWRGQPNTEAPFMDGVPLVTQCPILSYTTFQYKFRVSAPGTHLYQAFSDNELHRGLFGALIVRQPEKTDLQRKYYDVDSRNHVVLISERDKKVLVNGRGPSEVAKFTVKRNKRYRFRVAFTGGNSGCPVTLSVDNHPIKIIALDGNPVFPTEVTSVVLGKGERVDFVLKTHQKIKRHYVRVKSCVGEGLALLNYEGGETTQTSKEQEGRSLDTALCQSQIGKICLSDLNFLEKMPESLKSNPKVVYLSLGSKIVNVNGNFDSRVFGVNNLTFTYPSSPLLTQLDRVVMNTVCDEINVPEKCAGKEVCECVHVEHIPLRSAAEIVLINQDASQEEHIFHLHGYRFYLVGFRQFESTPSTEEIKLLDQQNALFKRNFNNPVLKDTVRIPKNSVVALRFLADNPGFWMLRDEGSRGWTRGLDIVLQVGEPSDMVSSPTDFPTCGNYIGPDFFLM